MTDALQTLLLLCLFAFPAFADNGGEKQLRGVDGEKLTHGLITLESKFVYLYDKKNHDRHAVKITNPAKMLPHRVHLKYDSDLHMWVFLKTDFDGKFPEPMEALRPDTVVPGSVIGAGFALQRFILTDDGAWAATRETEKYKIWVKSNPPELKVYTFEKKSTPRDEVTYMPPPSGKK